MDPANADKLVSVQDKLDIVKTVMKDNIQQILLNDEKIERIDLAADQLKQQSETFKTNSKQLTNKMYVSSYILHVLLLPFLVYL